MIVMKQTVKVIRVKMEKMTMMTPLWLGLMMTDTVSGEEVHGPKGTVLLPLENQLRCAQICLWWRNPLCYMNVLTFIYIPLNYRPYNVV